MVGPLFSNATTLHRSVLRLQAPHSRSHSQVRSQGKQRSCLLIHIGHRPVGIFYNCNKREPVLSDRGRGSRKSSGGSNFFLRSPLQLPVASGTGIKSKDYRLPAHTPGSAPAGDRRSTTAIPQFFRFLSMPLTAPAAHPEAQGRCSPFPLRSPSASLVVGRGII